MGARLLARSFIHAVHCICIHMHIHAKRMCSTVSGVYNLYRRQWHEYRLLPKGVIADAESKIPSFDGDDDDALIAIPIFIEVLYLFSWWPRNHPSHPHTLFLNLPLH